RQSHVRTRRQRVLLIMIEEAQHILAHLIGDQSPRDTTRPFRVLMRIHQVQRRASGDRGRIDRTFPPADPCPLQRQRKKYVRLAQRIMVEEVSGSRAEVAHVQRPTLERNRYAELSLLIAFPAQRKKRLLRIQQRIVYRHEWRRLVIASVKSPQHPSPLPHLHP